MTNVFLPDGWTLTPNQDGTVDLEFEGCSVVVHRYDAIWQVNLDSVTYQIFQYELQSEWDNIGRD